MSTLTALRWTGAIWFCPVVFAVGVYVGVRELAFRTGYPVADLAIASYELTLVGPIVAAYCAFRFGGFARSLDALTASRPGVVAVLGAWWPLVIGPPVAAVLALVVATQGSFPSDPVSWQIVGLVFLTVLASGCFGMALGHALPIAAAVPVAGAVAFWWLAFPGAGTSTTLRNINSGFVVCCTSAQVPSPVMIQGSALVVGVLTAGTLLSWTLPGWARRGRLLATGAVAGLVVTSVAAGAVHVRSAKEAPTLQAVSDRTTTRECNGGEQLRVCVWPEDEPRLLDVQDRLEAMNAQLGSLGLPLVARADEDVADGRTVGFSANDAMSSGDVWHSLADGYVRWQQWCRTGRASDPPAAVVAFVGLATGMPESSLRERFDGRAVSEGLSVLAQDDVAARSWLDRELGPESRSCGGRT